MDGTEDIAGDTHRIPVIQGLAINLAGQQCQKIESDDLAYGISPYHIHPNDTRFTKVLSIVFEEKQEERRTHMPTSENSVVYLFKK